LNIVNCDKCQLNGGGLIDGGGTIWYILFDEKKLQYNRPNLVVVEHCNDFTFTHVDLLNSPSFFVILNNVVTAEVAFINITAEWYNGGTKEPHNTDGIDPGSDSKNIHIHDCVIDNGDDGVAVKPGTIAGGCTKNILVENCHFIRGHGASIGSIADGCIEDVTFRGIKIDSEMAGCHIKAYNGTGHVSNIVWDNIQLTNTKTCIGIETNYKPGNPNAAVKISNITFSQITGSGCTVPGAFNCQSAAPCTGIHLKDIDVSINAKTNAMTCSNAHGDANNVKPSSCLTK